MAAKGLKFMRMRCVSGMQHYLCEGETLKLGLQNALVHRLKTALHREFFEPQSIYVNPTSS
jgi:hypothetical protein